MFWCISVTLTLACVSSSVSSGDSNDGLTGKYFKKNMKLSWPSYRPTTADYAYSHPLNVDLQNITISFWSRVTNTRDPTLGYFNYGAEGEMMHFYRTNNWYYVLTVNNQIKNCPGVKLDSSIWNHFLISWQGLLGKMSLWVDGKQLCYGYLRQGNIIRKGGTFLLGQTVTNWVPLRFSSTHEYNGDMAYFNVFEDTVSNKTEYDSVVRKSFLGTDAKIPWSSFFVHTHGKVKVIPEEKLYMKEFTSLRCNKKTMVLTIDREAFDHITTRNAVLSDNICKTSFVNRTHMIFRTNLTRCGTALQIGNHTATYSNILKTREPVIVAGSSVAGSAGISRDPRDMPTRGITFKCVYPTDTPTYIPLFTPYVSNAHLIEQGTDKFRHHVFLYTDTSYKSRHTHYPISAPINHRIAVEIKMEGHGADSRYSTWVRHCRASPSAKSNDTLSYDLIRNGCPVDDTVVFHDRGNNTTVNRFSFVSFMFPKMVRAAVFLHCSVDVCDVHDADSRCAQGETIC